MSQYGDDDGGTDVYPTSHTHTARKEHKCSACHETIRPGDRYTVVFWVYDKMPHQVKRCARCEVIFQHLSARIADEGAYEEFCDQQLKCGHEYADRWEMPPPEWLAALAFWRPGDPLPPLAAKPRSQTGYHTA